jgi:hypothetical protein
MDIQNIRVHVERHTSPQFCLMHMYAEIDGKEVKESISVHSSFILSHDQEVRHAYMQEILNKLMYDIVVKKSYFDKSLKESVNINDILRDMEEKTS